MTTDAAHPGSPAGARGQRAGVTGLLRDILLGARLSLRGGAAAWLRLVLTAVAIGASVTALLVAAAIGPAIDARSGRSLARMPVTADVLRYHDVGSPASLLPPPLLEIHGRTLDSATNRVTGYDVAALTPDPPVPPGVARFPAPGEMVVSPALARLLASPEGAGLLPRLDGTVIGQIDTGAVLGPDELYFYRGIAASGNLSGATDPAQGVGVAWGWGTDVNVGAPDPVLDDTDRLAITSGVGILLVPLLVFIALAARLGGAARGRRLAALRLVGASVVQVRRFAVGEALLAAAGGLVIAVGGFLAARAVASGVRIGGVSFFASDLTPSVWSAIAVAILVPGLAIGAVLAGQLRLTEDPLSVRRALPPAPRQSWWRLALAGLAAILVGVGRPVEQSLVPGLVIAILCVPVLAPYLVEKLAQHAPVRGVSRRLAVRRLQADSGGVVRVVSGLAVVVCALITLLPLLQYAGERVIYREGDSPAGMSSTGLLMLRMVSADELADAVPAVSQAAGGRAVVATVYGTDSDSVTVATCASLSALTGLACPASGIAYAALDGPRVPPTTVVVQTTGAPRIIAVNAPESVPVDPAAPFRYTPGLILTPQAFRTALGPGQVVLPNSNLMVDTTGMSAADLDAVRNAVAPLEWRADSTLLLPTGQSRVGRLMDVARTGLWVGGLLVVLVAVLSLIVLTVEQANDRRRTNAAALAIGVPWPVLARSMLLAVLVPAVVAIVVAIGIGVVLSLALVNGLSSTAVVQPVPIVVVSLLAGGAVALITAAVLPAVRRTARPAALRTE